MYTEKEKINNKLQVKQRFKFVNRSGRALRSNGIDTQAANGNKNGAKEINEVEKEEFQWPRELMAIMNQIQPVSKTAKGKATKIKTFYSLNEKIKAYILATNFSPVLDSYVKNQDPRTPMISGHQVSDEAFTRALDHWSANQLFSFDDALAAVT